MAREYPTVLDLVGATPIVRLDKLGRDVAPTLLAKLEYLNPGGSVKEQTGGELDAIVISVGTGGTISGVGRFFKERKPEILIVGADPEGSVYTAQDDGGVHPYLVEGIGKDSWPKTMNPEVVDEWIRVSDRDSFLTARRLARVCEYPDALEGAVANAVQPPLATIDAGDLLDEVFPTLPGRADAVVVAREGRPVAMITRSDLLEYLAHRRGNSLS